MPETYLRIGLALLAAAFGAGGYAVLLRTTRRDVNGLGGVVRAQHRAIERLRLVLLTFCPDEKREKILELLLAEEKKNG